MPGAISLPSRAARILLLSSWSIAYPVLPPDAATTPSTLIASAAGAAALRRAPPNRLYAAPRRAPRDGGGGAARRYWPSRGAAPRGAERESSQTHGQSPRTRGNYSPP